MLEWLLTGSLSKHKSCSICSEKMFYSYHRESFKGKRRMLLLAFLLQEKRLLMAEPKTIYCPKCNRKVGTYDGRSIINHYCSCKNCNKLVVYYVETGEVKLKEMPKRHCSSGMIFY